MGGIIDNLALGFAVALSLQNITLAFIGCLLGTLIGVLPGVGPRHHCDPLAGHIRT
jgi:putative tricarboxylic transport membrane protein